MSPGSAAVFSSPGRVGLSSRLTFSVPTTARKSIRYRALKPIVISPPLEGYPSGDDVADAARVNRVVEEQARRHLPQYLWVHRRFKTQPTPGDSPYRR